MRAFGLVIVWLIAVVGGMHLVWRHALTPGHSSAAPMILPAGTTLRGESARMTLVVVLHPKCPCTRATITQLAQVLSLVDDSTVSVCALCYLPERCSADWALGDNYRRIRSIPGVRVQIDPGGREAQRFGANVSGQVLLYSRSGNLLYTGGVTGARGHEGYNSGQQALCRALRSGVRMPSAPVYGCTLFLPTRSLADRYAVETAMPRRKP